MARFTPNYYIACRIQDKILNMIGVMPQNKSRHDPKAKRNLTPSELSTLTKAFDTMEERKRILRNKPLPKAQEVERPKDKRRPVHETFRE